MWRLKTLPAIAAFLAAFLSTGWGGAPALAQSIMRSPNLNISSRIPRIDPNIAGRSVTGLNGETLRIRPSCTAAERDLSPSARAYSSSTATSSSARLTLSFIL